MVKKAFKIFPAILSVLLAVAIVILLFTDITTVYAGSFTKKNKAFAWLGNGNVADSDTYPYNSKTATINSVSIDVLYGNTRNLIVYYGEVPEAETTSGNDDRVDSFEGYYCRPGTTLAQGVTQYGVDTKNYWGFDLSENLVTVVKEKDENNNDVDKVTLWGLESVNSQKVVSLRLYALENSNEPALLNFIYIIALGLARFATMILQLIVMAKNIDVNIILDALKLDDLADLLSKTLIWDPDQKTLSPFVGFMIIMWIFALVAYTIKYVRGQSKERGILEMLGTVALGLIIIGMCLSGRLSTLGSAAANVASKIMYAVAGSLQDNGDSGNAWKIDIEDPENENQIVQLQEMSMINRAFMDIQICTQFDVNDVKVLKHEALGGSALGGGAAQSLEGITWKQFTTDFNNNLGYYYWFANSDAVEHPVAGKSIPDTNVNIKESKLESMITYLQEMYVSDHSKTRIKNIIVALAIPHPWKGFLRMFLYFLIILLLCFCLFFYALFVLIGKIELFIALLGLTLAGPMLISGNKKLETSGKQIMGFMVCSLLQITIYSTFFDIILYVVASLLSTDILRMLVTLGVIVVFIMFRKRINETLKSLMDGIENKLAPDAVKAKRSMKNWAARKMQSAEQWASRRQKNIYDDEGNVIGQKFATGGFLHSAIRAVNNEAFASADNHKGFASQLVQSRKERRGENLKEHKARLQAAESKLSGLLSDIKTNAADKAAEIKDDAKERYNSIIKMNSEGKYEVLDTSLLTDEEKENYDLAQAALSKSLRLKNNSLYLEALRKRNAGQELSEQEMTIIDNAETQIKANERLYSDTMHQLNDDIKERTLNDAINENEYINRTLSESGMNVNDITAETAEERVEKVTNIVEQQKEKETLTDAINAVIDENAVDTNRHENAKIGGSTSDQKEAAVRKIATAAVQLDQLKHGEVVDTNLSGNLQKQVNDIVTLSTKKQAPKAEAVGEMKIARDENGNALKDENGQTVIIKNAEHEERRLTEREIEFAKAAGKKEFGPDSGLAGTVQAMVARQQQTNRSVAQQNEVIKAANAEIRKYNEEKEAKMKAENKSEDEIKQAMLKEKAEVKIADRYVGGRQDEYAKTTDYTIVQQQKPTQREDTSAQDKAELKAAKSEASARKKETRTEEKARKTEYRQAERIFNQNVNNPNASSKEVKPTRPTPTPEVTAKEVEKKQQEMKEAVNKIVEEAKNAPKWTTADPNPKTKKEEAKDTSKPKLKAHFKTEPQVKTETSTTSKQPTSTSTQQDTPSRTKQDLPTRETPTVGTQSSKSTSQEPKPTSQPDFVRNTDRTMQDYINDENKATANGSDVGAFGSKQDGTNGKKGN